MREPTGAPPPLRARRDGDFVALLAERGAPVFPAAPAVSANAAAIPVPCATTVLGFCCREGVIVAGDRRATAGHTVIYERANKVIELDSGTVMAIAGTPSTAFEMARVLQHSFRYFRRSQLQPLSRAAKVRALGELIKQNLSLTLQGVGIVVPLLAAHEAGHGPQLYFYDALGAQFEAVDFAVSGSGAPAARSVLQYLTRWGDSPAQRKAEEGARLAIELLDVAAESDTATGGIDRRSWIYPQVALLSEHGLRMFGEDELRRLMADHERASASKPRKGAA